MKTKTKKKPEGKANTRLSDVDEDLVNMEEANESGEPEDEEDEFGEEEYMDEDTEEDEDEYEGGFRGRTKSGTRSKR